MTPLNSFKMHRGYSLIEVLVALLMLSFGLLSIAAIEIKSLQQTQQALHYSVAVQQVSNMFERLQAVTTRSARLQQCQLWQAQNKLLLPNAVGSCEQQNAFWVVKLKWGIEAHRALTMEMRL